MRRITTAFLFLLVRLVSAQEPGTYISVSILKDTKIIYGEELKAFTVKVNGVFPVENMHVYVPDYEKGEFGFFNWDPYNNQVYEIKILHNEDSMQVRFQMKDIKPTANGYVWNANFHLDIPYHAGYFEVREFYNEKPPFTIRKSYKWANLPLEKRKLWVWSQEIWDK